METVTTSTGARTNCGRETCLGLSCGNFVKPNLEKGIKGGCRGVNWNVPPWNFMDRKPGTAKISIRMQDVLEAADELANAVENDFIQEALFKLAKKYKQARFGKKES